MSDIPPPKESTSKDFILAFCLAGLALIGFALYAYIPEFFTAKFWYTKSWEKAGETFIREPSIIIRNFGLVILSAGALYFAWWRAKTADKQAKISERQAKIGREQLSQFTVVEASKALISGSELIGRQEETERLTGLHILRDLALQYPIEYVNLTLSVFCNFARRRAKQDHTAQEKVQVIKAPAGPTPEARRPPNDLDYCLRQISIIQRAVIKARAEIDPLSGLNLNKVNLENYILWDIDFSGAHMADANIVNAAVTSCSFNNCIFTRSNFRSAEIDDCKFGNATLKNTCFEEAIITNTELADCIISGANFSGAIISQPIDFTAVQRKTAWAWEDLPPTNGTGPSTSWQTSSLVPIELRPRYEATRKFGIPRGWIPPSDQD